MRAAGHLPDRAAVDKSLDAPVARVETLIVADRQRDAVGAASLDHPASLASVQRHRLFAQDNACPPAPPGWSCRAWRWGGVAT